MKGCGAAHLWLPCLLFLVTGAAAIPGHAAPANPQSRELAPWRIERDTRRFEILDTDALWDVLAIRPGMTILDIGTGTGQFAYAFAERLQGRGKVYATDVNETCIPYVQEQAAQRKLKNVFPALVKKGGADEFYRSGTYDLIALFHVALDYEKEVDLLRDLRGALADDGRLVLIVAREFPDFSPGDFTDDHRGLVREILQEPADTPYHKAVRESTRELLRAPPGASSPVDPRKVIAEDFNLVLADANFGMAFFEGSAFRKELDFSRDEWEHADWLTIPNDWERVTRGLKKGDWVSPRNGRMINKLLLVQKYRRYLKSSALYAPGLSAAGRAAFARAGYVLQREHTDLLPFRDVVVYTRGLPITGRAGQGGLAGRSFDFGLWLRDPFNLPIAREHDSGGAGVVTISAGENGAVRARMRMQEGVSPQEASRYIAEQTALLLSVFETSLPPYPEFLTRESGCPQEFKPTERTNRLGPYHVLYAGERFGYGVCTDDLAVRRAAIGHVYCPVSRRLFSLEYFIPREADASTLVDIFDSLRCRDGAAGGGGQ